MAGLALGEVLGALTVEGAKDIVGASFWDSLNLELSQITGVLTTIASFIAMNPGNTPTNRYRLQTMLQRNYGPSALSSSQIASALNRPDPTGASDRSRAEESASRDRVRARIDNIARDNPRLANDYNDLTAVASMFPNESDASIARIADILGSGEHKDDFVTVDIIDEVERAVENDPLVPTAGRSQRFASNKARTAAIIASAAAAGVVITQAFPSLGSLTSGSVPSVPSAPTVPSTPSIPSDPTAPVHLPRPIHHAGAQAPSISQAGAQAQAQAPSPPSAQAGAQAQAPSPPSAQAGAGVASANPLLKIPVNKNYDPTQPQIMRLGINQNNQFNTQYMRFGRYKFPTHGTFRYDDVYRYINGALYKNVIK